VRIGFRGKIADKRGFRTFCGKIMDCLFSSFEKLRRGRAKKRCHLEQMYLWTVNVFDRIESIKECPVLN